MQSGFQREMIRVALTHDVDRIYKTYQYLTRSIKYLLRGQLKNLIKEISSISNRKHQYWNIEDIMRREEELGVRSTFFFLHESIPFSLINLSNWKLSLGRYKLDDSRVREVIRGLDGNGWEIGLHGSYQSYSNEQLLLHEKKLIEEITGHEVQGIRQHYLNVNENTWNIQKKVGFKYDSSLGYTRDIGFKDGIITPFQPMGDEFLVFPLSIMDSCFMQDPDRDRKLSIIMEQVEKSNGVLVINWHSNNFNDFEYPGYADTYYRLIREFRCLGAEFSTLGESYTYFKNKLDIQ